MKMVFCLTALSIATFLAASSYAQDDQPTTASLYGGDTLPLSQRMACLEDIHKLCKDALPQLSEPAGDAIALKCLHENISDISPRCLKAVKNNNPDWNNANTNWDSYVKDNTSAPGQATTEPTPTASMAEPNNDTAAPAGTSSGNSSAPPMLITVPHQQ